MRLDSNKTGSFTYVCLFGSDKVENKYLRLSSLQPVLDKNTIHKDHLTYRR